MSYGLALNLSNKFAAVASVAGTMTDEMIASGNPTRSVPIFHIHGNLDPVVPYDGSAGTLPTFGVLSSVNETLNFWNSIDGCTDYSTSNISNINVFDLCSASKRVYYGCAEHPNWYVEITGGGHTWPGTTPLTVTGNTCQDFNGSSLIWEFFSTCSLPTASSSEISSVKEMPVEYFNCLGKKISPNQITRGELIIVRWSSGRISKEMVY